MTHNSGGAECPHWALSSSGETVTGGDLLGVVLHQLGKGQPGQYEATPPLF